MMSARKSLGYNFQIDLLTTRSLPLLWLPVVLIHSFPSIWWLSSRVRCRAMENSNGEGKVLTVASSVPLLIRLVRFLRSLLRRYRAGITNVRTRLCIDLSRDYIYRTRRGVLPQGMPAQSVNEQVPFSEFLKDARAGKLAQVRIRKVPTMIDALRMC